jgi:ATP-dependent protease ClpP protease subunit
VEVINAGSASALVAACSPGRRLIRSDGKVMMHSCWQAVCGTPSRLRQVAAELEAANEKWVAKLAARTGQPMEICGAWLNRANIIFDAQAALDHGLVDAVIEC